MSKTVAQIVESYYDAWKTKDESKFLLTKDFSFDGPIASFTNPDDFVKMAKQVFPMAKGVKLLETFYKENKACVMLEFSTNTPVGSWVAIDYFLIENDRIKYSRTMYDPRKLVEFMQSQQKG